MPRLVGSLLWWLVNAAIFIEEDELEENARYNSTSIALLRQWNTRHLSGIYGLSSDCGVGIGLPCLAAEKWQCWYNFNSETPINENHCKFDFSPVSGRYGWDLNPGAVSKFTMCASDSTGVPTVCGEGTDSDTNLELTGCFYDVPSPIADITSVSLQPVKKNVFSAFAIAACYCPSVDVNTYGAKCGHKNDYTQNFGTIFVWTAKICDYANVDGTCEQVPYMRAFPHQYFTLRIECPNGGCDGNATTNPTRRNNRVKYLNYNLETDRPNWANQGLERNSCMQAAESEDVHWLNPNGVKDGGSLLTYKKWKDNQVRIDAPRGAIFEVCYCNDICDDHANYFKVGEIRMAEFVGLASKARSAADATPALDVVTKPGTITFYGGITNAGDTAFSPLNSNKWSGEAAINLLSIDRKKSSGKTLEETKPENMDKICQDTGYENQIWLNNNGPTSVEHVLYNGYPSGTQNGITPDNYLAFHGQSGSERTMAARLPGLYAVCYCAIIEAKNCVGNWRHVSNMTIRGPVARISPFYSGGTLPPYVEYKIPIDMPFSLEFDGYAFRSTDKLRFVPHTTNCEDATDPDGLDNHYKIGCPTNTCRLAVTKENIATHLTTSDSTAVFAQTVAFDPLEETWTVSFDGDIVNHVAEGDRITFDLVTIVVQEREENNWDDEEAYLGQRFGGIYYYADQAATLPPDRKTYLVPNIARYKRRDADNSVEPRMLVFKTTDANTENQYINSLGVGKLKLAFKNNKGTWSKRNKLFTAKELKATQVISTQNICWGIGDNEYYSKAGEISFIQSHTMITGAASLLTQMDGIEAPIILSFTISTTRTKYSTIDGQLELVIRFKDANGQLKPRLIQDTDKDPTTNALAGEVNGSQDMCGKLFKELWSNDVHGFPLPEKCYFTTLRTDAEPGSKPTLEYVIRFAKLNRLKRVCTVNDVDTDCSYQIVVMGIADGITKDDNIVDLFTTCIGCSDNTLVLEKGVLLASKTTYARSTKPRLSDVEGALLTDENDGVSDRLLDLTYSQIIQMKLKGQDGQYQIREGSILRVFLWPLTEWKLRENCNVSCTPGATSTKCESSQVSCETEETVKGSDRYNVLKVTFPLTSADFTPITSQTPDQHSVQFPGLPVPVSGFFPTQISVEISEEADDRIHPDYKETDSSSKIMKDPNMSAYGAVGQIVFSGQVGSGTESFIASPNNVVFVLIRFPLSIRGYGSDYKYGIDLPSDFECDVADNNGAWDPSELPAWLITDNEKQQKDYNLGLVISGGTFSQNSAQCLFQLATDQVLYTDMTILVKLNLRNPSQAIQKVNPDNLWKTSYVSPLRTVVGSYLTLEEEVEGKWMGNVGILSSLLRHNCQPAPPEGTMYPFQPSATFFLNIFFQTRQSGGRLGKIYIDAPKAFSFKNPCVVRDLPDEYYALQDSPDTRLKRIAKTSNIHDCTTLVHPVYSRAQLGVGGFLFSTSYYGFKIGIATPEANMYAESNHLQWRLWILDSNSYPIDGTSNSLRFNVDQQVADQEFHEQSWGMFGRLDTYIKVNIASYTPSSVNSDKTTLTVLDIIEDFQVLSTLRVTIASGYEWGDISSFNIQPTGATEKWPDVPVIENRNQLVWIGGIVFLPYRRYGFSIDLVVPDYTPTGTTNAIYFEFGYGDSEINNDELRKKRSKAQAIPLQQIKSLINAVLGFSSNRKGYANNRMEFRVQTVTALLASPEGLGIYGNEQTKGFVPSCDQIIPEGAPQVFGKLSCSIMVVDDLPKISLKVTSVALPPDDYRFVILMANPEEANSNAAVWTIGTYKDVVNFLDPVDKSIDVTGFRINNPMPQARLVRLMATEKRAIGRDDRPSHASSLLFAFRIDQEAGSTGDLVLRGPDGFRFAENCLYDLYTSPDDVFGGGMGDEFESKTFCPTIGKQPCYQYTVWYEYQTPTACYGLENVARISIPAGLKTDEKTFYVFRIGILENPITTPLWNYWSISFNGESSEPFESFEIATFPKSEIIPASTSTGEAGPVEIFFEPFNTVPGSGVIKIFAPSVFTFVQENNECVGAVFGVDKQIPYEYFELKCEVLPTDNQLLLYFARLEERQFAEKGKVYRLAVQVQNPTGSQKKAGIWRIESYSEFTGDFGSIVIDEIKFLDAVNIIGYAISEKMTVWSVCQTEGGENSCEPVKRNGLTDLEDVIFSMQFKHDVKPTDRITILGPKDYIFALDPTGEFEIVCLGFEWVGGDNPFSETEPTCLCDLDENRCTMEFILESDANILPNSKLVQFHVDMQNPRKTPDMAQNGWKMTHFDQNGEMYSGSTVPSWPIVPQLELDLKDIEIVGQNQAAGQITDLDITFLPVSSARSIRIQVDEPAGFEFDYSILSPTMSGSGFSISKKNTTGNVITIFGRMLADNKVTFSINSVLLANGGGPTKWTFKTYKNRHYSATDLMDERNNMDGFRLPGKIMVTEQELSSEYRDRKTEFPVQSLFQARIGEEATVEFQLTFTRNVQATERLRITSLGEGAYDLRPTPFIVIGSKKVETAVMKIDGALEATVLPDGSTEEVAIYANSPYQVIMKAVPAKGITSWKFETLDGARYPTNTNDSETPGFHPVNTLGVVVEVATRSPPKAEVEVIITIKFEGTSPTSLLIIAPANFIFPVGLSGCGLDCMPSASFGSTGRKTAEIRYGSRESGDSIRVKINTPMMTPAENDLQWFVEARSLDETLGWGHSEGFPINQMQNIEIVYPALADMEMSKVAISFTTSDIDDGNQILVEQPNGFLLYCSEGKFKQVSLPGDLPDCVDEPLALTLSVNLERNRDYSFVLGIDTPSQDIPSSQNTWNIIIKNFNLIVVDAKYGFEGPPLIPFSDKRSTSLDVSEFTMSWTKTVPGQKTEITCGITFEDETTGVAAVLIEFPEYFTHDITFVAAVKNNAKKFPAKSGDAWVDASKPESLKLLIEEKEELTPVPAGVFNWTFPILVPCCGQEDFPKRNIWHLSLCADAKCTSRSDKSVLATFPHEGFDASDENDEEGADGDGTSDCPAIVPFLHWFSILY